MSAALYLMIQAAIAGIDTIDGNFAAVRAVLGWMTCVQDGEVFLAASLDLALAQYDHDPQPGDDGQWIASSNSFNNNNEMVEYTNRNATTRWIWPHIVKSAWFPCNGYQQEYAGLAWVVHRDGTMVP